MLDTVNPVVVQVFGTPLDYGIRAFWDRPRLLSTGCNKKRGEEEDHERRRLALPQVALQQD